MQRKNFIVGLVAVWLIAVAIGFGFLHNYGARSSSEFPLPSPVNSQIDNSEEVITEGAIRNPTGRRQLLMFVHPMCPCTRASIHELERIVAQSATRFETTIYVWQPADAAYDWTDSDLIRSARLIPNVAIEHDIDGIKAKSLSASTSGHVLLFDPDGRFRYSGGITSTRGHAGDNYGSASILAALANSSAATKGIPVFGCQLENNSLDTKP